MKISFIIMLLTCMVVMSKTTLAQVSFGPSAGVQYSSVIGGYSYIKYHWEYGYQAGSFVSFPLEENQFLRSGLFINSLGYKYYNSEPYNSGTASSTFRLHLAYLQMPVEWMRMFKSGLHVEGGCFAEYQISQHAEELTYYMYPVDTLVEISEAGWEDHQITAKRFQAGLMASFGYLYSDFDLSLSSEGNLTTLFRKKEANYKGEHLFALSLSLAYHIR